MHIPTYEEVRDLHYNTTAPAVEPDDDDDVQVETQSEPVQTHTQTVQTQVGATGGEPKCPFWGTLV